VDVQLPGQPSRLRRRGPGHADLRRNGLLTPYGLRTHLPPPPSLPHHRRRRGDPDPPCRRLPVRLHRRRARFHRSLTTTEVTTNPEIAASSPPFRWTNGSDFGGGVSVPVMCRSITTLRGLEPAATSEEIEAAARQFVRKISGIR